MPGFAGYLLDDETYLSGELYYLPPASSSSSLRAHLFKPKKKKWLPIRLLIQQKKIEVYSMLLNNGCEVSDREMLSHKHRPKFVIEMHRKLSLTPLKVYTNKHADEKLSLALIETDVRRTNSTTNSSGSGSSSEEMLIRLGSEFPLQFTFIQIALNAILNSFHQ